MAINLGPGLQQLSQAIGGMDSIAEAVSAKKAIANIRYRIAGQQCNCPTTYWKAWEA